MDYIRSEGAHWMYSCPKQRNELAVAGITKVKRDKLKPGKFCLAMFETFHHGPLTGKFSDVIGHR